MADNDPQNTNDNYSNWNERTESWLSGEDPHDSCSGVHDRGQGYEDCNGQAI